MKTLSRFSEFREFKYKKLILENDCNKLLGFYEFNKCALISEFSLKDYYAFLERSINLLNKNNEDFKSITEINVIDKINNVISFDGTKTLYGSKNYLPRNITTIYQPVDRTNQIISYNSDTEKFRKIVLLPKKLRGFSFYPYCRYLNFNGRLFISGGYQDSKLSKTFWTFEDRHISNTDGVIRINRQNVMYEDENFPNFCIYKCPDMINPRSGHAMIGMAPNIILIFGGTEGLKSCEMFELGKNKWEEISSLNETRIDPSPFVYKSYLYIFFGLKYDKSSKKFNFMDTIERIPIFSLQTSEWEYVVPKFPDDKSSVILGRSLSGIVVKNNSTTSIYICGGQVAKEKFSSDIFEYDFETNLISLSEKKLPKPSAFLEQNFIYLFKTGINFDIYGDMFYYQSSDNFNFQFQKFLK